MANRVVNYVFLLVSVCLWMHTCRSYTDKYTVPGDSLKPGDILNYTNQLCSKGTTFRLHFDQPRDPAFTYFLIWNRTQPAIIWVGNRNEPVVNNSSVLILDHSGELKIHSQGKLIKVLYFPIQPINNTQAILHDNGNFVLQQFHPNGSNTVLWQSFDHPTDAIVPGMKSGVNHKTGHKWSLVSWIATNNPSAVDFELEWQPINGKLVIRVRGSVCWKSGSYRNNIPFENMQDEIHSIYRFHIVSNEEEDFLTFTPRSKSNDGFSYWSHMFQHHHKSR